MNTTILLFAIIVPGFAAGEEFIVRWGLQPAMNKLPDYPHLLARQALIRRLKIVVPFLMLHPPADWKTTIRRWENTQCKEIIHHGFPRRGCMIKYQQI
jgi:hypothetical protein